MRVGDVAGNTWQALPRGAWAKRLFDAAPSALTTFAPPIPPAQWDGGRPWQILLATSSGGQGESLVPPYTCGSVSHSLSPRHPPHFFPLLSFLELNSMIWSGEQCLPGPRRRIGVFKVHKTQAPDVVNGGAVQVDPIKPMLKAPGANPLKLTI
jgi:hypothetical protein